MSYEGQTCIITTMHGKEDVIAPVFKNVLGMDVKPIALNTDKLGTFSGEVSRKLNALACARRKCEWGMKKSRALYGLASEGSFGHHPFIPFIPNNNEILYFIDKKRKFHIHVSENSSDTNYQSAIVNNYEQVLEFCEKSLFPSHALIVRPHKSKTKNFIFKGIQNYDELENAFKKSIKNSLDSHVLIQTDMRAHFNPSRMKVIQSAAQKLAERLKSICPQCETPGWGLIKFEAGLKCCLCGLPTQEIKSEIWGCTKCRYKENKARKDKEDFASPTFCAYCNP